MKAQVIKMKPFFRVEIVSRCGTKSCTVTKYSQNWQIQYTSNGQRKNVQNYNDALLHLESRGWNKKDSATI